MRLHSATAALVTLLALAASAFASIRLNYQSNVFEISYLPSDIFPNARDPVLGPDRYVWHVLGLVGNVHFPPTWETCGSDAVPASPCTRGASLLLPVSSSRLGTATGLTYILPANRTATLSPVSAVLYAPPSVYPIASATGALNFTGVDASDRSDIFASYIPTSEDPYTPYGSLLVQMTYKDGAVPIQDKINRIDVILPENFWVVPNTGAYPPLGTNTSIPARAEAFVGSVVDTFNSYWAVTDQLKYASVYGSGRALSLRFSWPIQFHPVCAHGKTCSFVFVINGVYSSRDDSGAPAVRAFFSNYNNPSYAAAPAPISFVPSVDGAIIGRGISVIGFNSSLTSPDEFDLYRTRMGLDYSGHGSKEHYARFLMANDPIYGSSVSNNATAVMVIRASHPWSRAQFETGNVADLARAQAENYPDDEDLVVSFVEPWMPSGLWKCLNYPGSGLEGSYIPCPMTRREYCRRGDAWEDVCVVGDDDAPALMCAMSRELRRYAC